MTTLILGSAGQLGTAIRRLLPKAIACTRQQADLTKPETLRPLIEQHRPKVVLNCAAYNVVDQAERDVAGAFVVNAFAVRELALACRDVGATLMHFSTNYVFGEDVERRIPYQEDDAPGPVSAYANSKLAGEYFALSASPAHLVIRTCGLYGAVERASAPWNFIEKLLDRARRPEPLRVVDDQVGTPTAAFDLAEGALNLLGAGARGLYQFTNAGACSWHEFATEALRLACIPREIEAVSSETFNAPARRPAFSVLDCGKYDRHGFAPRRTWQAALVEYIRQRSAQS